MQGYLWINWVKLAGALWIIGVKIRQLINILFCGYRRSRIRDPRQMHAETYTRPGHRVPQRVITEIQNKLQKWEGFCILTVNLLLWNVTINAIKLHVSNICLADQALFSVVMRADTDMLVLTRI